MEEKKLAGRNYTIALACAAALTVLCVAAWASSMVNGFVETGMRNFIPWGAGIGAFAFFAAVSGGALACAALPYALGIERFKSTAKISAWLSFATIGGAVVAIMTDIGSPQRALEMVFRPNLGSPLFADMVVLTLYAIVLVAFLVMLVRDAGGIRIMSWAAICAMVVLQVVEANIFAGYSTHVAWSTPLMYPWFLASALAAGMGLVVCSCALLVKSEFLRLEEGVGSAALKILAAFVAVDLCFAVVDVAISPEVAGVLVSGPLAPLFWCQVVLSVAAIMLGFMGKSPLVTGVLALLAGCVHKLCLVMEGFQIPNLSMEGVVTSQMLPSAPSSVTEAFSQLVYVPSLSEIALLCGIVGFVALLALLGLRYLPLADN